MLLHVRNFATTCQLTRVNQTNTECVFSLNLFEKSKWSPAAITFIYSMNNPDDLRPPERAHKWTIHGLWLILGPFAVWLSSTCTLWASKAQLVIAAGYFKWTGFSLKCTTIHENTLKPTQMYLCVNCNIKSVTIYIPLKCMLENKKKIYILYIYCNLFHSL